MLVLSLLACGPVGDPPRTTTVTWEQDLRESPYPVEGATFEALMRSVDERAKAFAVAGEGSYDADTHWELGWRWQSKPVGLGCELDVTVAVEIVTVMPEWNPPTPPSPALAARWQAWLAELRTHEDGHRDLALAHGHALEEELRSFVPETCGRPRGVDVLGEAAVRRNDAEQLAYDALTEHGRHQERWPTEPSPTPEVTE